MQQACVQKFITVVLLLLALSLAACSDEKPVEKSTAAYAGKDADPDGTVARVGDEVITYAQLNSMLNSSAMIGQTIPSLGTDERNQMMLAMLNKMINANLIYLDARARGTDRLASYKEDVHRFEDAMLASRYRHMLMQGDSQVSELDVLHYYNTRTGRETELTDDLRLAIEAAIRKNKLDAFETTLHGRLRENVEVVINEEVLGSEYDDMRSDADVVASYQNHRITWSQVKDMMKNAGSNDPQAAFYIADNAERITRLQQYIDNAIMALKGRKAGLEKDTVYVERTAEYRKARLINEHRNGLIHSWNPSEDELQAYYAEHMDMFMVPEARRVQSLVARTREDAESIKAQIEQGDMTLGQAAQQFSIDPGAKYTQGDLGWISKGTGAEGLEQLIFSMQPEVVSDPIESAAGWQLLKVLAVAEPHPESLDNPQTRERAFRAYMQDRLNSYLAELRNNRFEVAVYRDELQRQFRREAEFIADLNRQEQAETRQRIEEMQQWLTQPTP